MSDSVSRYEDLERTDVLPQLSLAAADKAVAAEYSTDNSRDNHGARAITPSESAAKQSDGARNASTLMTSQMMSQMMSEGRIQTMPSKPLPMTLEVGGIRGKIADLESKLLETQDDKVDLSRQCQQLESRANASEQRAIKAEAEYVLQTSELSRITQRANDAEQRLNEQRVRLEAQLASIDRQLVDARARGDKRSLKLEQLLNQETERAVQSERDAGSVRLELEKVRGDLNTAHTALESLQERAAKQTRAAAEISRLYAQQSNQAETFAVAMEKNHQHVARIQAAKADSDQQAALLQDKLRAADDDISRLQADIVKRERATSELQACIEQRDLEVTELQNRGNLQALEIRELQATQQAIETHNTELQISLRSAQADVEQKRGQVQRLDTEIQQHEERIQQLESDYTAAQTAIRERDRLLVDEQTRVHEALEQKTATREQLRTAEIRLQAQQNEMEGLQGELRMRQAEFAESITTIESLKNEGTHYSAEKTAHLTRLAAQQAAIQKLETERDQIEMENRASRAELMEAQARYEEAVEAIVVAREAISVRERRNASLEQELHATIARLHETTARTELSTTAVATLSAELRDRDSKLAAMEQKLAEHVAALNAIGQDIERVNAAHPNEAFAALGYALESLDNSTVVHRLIRSTTTVGRSHSNDISIDSTSVSRYHARLLVKPEGVWLVDLQSTNGCGVNNRRASRQILCDGDTVLIGHCRFRFTTSSAIETHTLTQRDVDSAATPLPRLQGEVDSSARFHHH